MMGTAGLGVWTSGVEEATTRPGEAGGLRARLDGVRMRLASLTGWRGRGDAGAARG